MRIWFGTCFLAAVALVGTAVAEPLLQVKNGKTTIEFDEILAIAFVDCDVSRIKQGNIKPDGSRLRLPVTGGALDPNEAVGEIQHGGGVAIQCPVMVEGVEVEKTVTLQNFVVDLLGQTPVITALVTVTDGENAVPPERKPLFTVGGENLSVDQRGRSSKIEVSGAELGLTEGGADVLLELGIDMEPGTLVGTADSRFSLRKADKRKDDDDDDGDDGDDDDDEDDEDDEDDDDDDDDDDDEEEEEDD